MSFINPDHVSVTLSPVFTSKGLCAFMRATPVQQNADTTTSVDEILCAQPHLAPRLTDLYVEQLLADHTGDSLPVAVRLPQIGEDGQWTNLFTRLSESEAPFVLELEGTQLLTSPVEAAALIATARSFGLSVYACAGSTADMHAYTLLGIAGIVAGDVVFTARPKMI
ncbi:MAG: hypothetical protein GC134_07565 [Proteobacteria bacterium]|nr:hypothetical protein [Pseudomonadota bacterium]